MFRMNMAAPIAQTYEKDGFQGARCVRMSSSASLSSYSSSFVCRDIRRILVSCRKDKMRTG